MNWIEKAKQRGVAGFSLLELMVVVAILGVLAMVAVPRYNIFRARARQSEAKTNLGVIFTLQEAFRIENEQYYDGNGTTWGGDSMNTNGSRQGYRGGGTRTCERNKLGFRLANCNSSRYGYFVAGADEDEFLAVAYGASDAPATSNDERVFPGCAGGDGTDLVRAANTTRPTNKQDRQCNLYGAAGLAPNNSLSPTPLVPSWGETSFNTGDAWCMDERRHLENYRDIVEFCDE